MVEMVATVVPVPAVVVVVVVHHAVSFSLNLKVR